MRHGTFYSTDLKATVKQVNKTTAAKLFASGETIYLQSCNMRFDNVWQIAYAIYKDEGITFNNLVNSYTCYNCDNARGRYPNFFIINH